jgi:hypothetical protein
VPQRRYNPTITAVIWIILFSEIISVYSENHTKSVNMLGGQNVDLLSVKAGRTDDSCAYVLDQHCEVRLSAF